MKSSKLDDSGSKQVGQGTFHCHDNSDSYRILLQYTLYGLGGSSTSLSIMAANTAANTVPNRQQIKPDFGDYFLHIHYICDGWKEVDDFPDIWQ